MNKEDIEFLKESNAIELEYSKEALHDSIQAWTMALLMSKESNTIDYIFGIHRRLLKRLNPKIAGKFRDVPVMIGGEIKYNTKEEIIKDLKKLLKIVPKTHHEIKAWHVMFEDIHPFEDGNGRTGRILMNIQRLKINLPILIIYEEEKFKYYKWFK